MGLEETGQLVEEFKRAFRLIEEFAAEQARRPREEQAQVDVKLRPAVVA